MSSLRIGLLLSAAGVAMTLGMSSVRADFTVVQTPAKIPLTQTNWSPTTTSLAGVNPFVFNQFDVSKYSVNGQTAVVTQIDLKLDYEFDNTLQYSFANMATIKVSANGSMDLFMPDGKTPGVTSPTFTNSASVSADPSTILNHTYTLPTQKYTGSQAASYTDQTTLNQFLGKGTVSMPVFAQATSNFTSNTGNGFGSSVTYASAAITLTIHYVLVPEPSAVVLFGLGLMGLKLGVRTRSRLGVKKSASN